MDMHWFSGAGSRPCAIQEQVRKHWPSFVGAEDWGGWEERQIGWRKVGLWVDWLRKWDWLPAHRPDPNP